MNDRENATRNFEAFVTEVAKHLSKLIKTPLKVRAAEFNNEQFFVESAEGLALRFLTLKHGAFRPEKNCRINVLTCYPESLREEPYFPGIDLNTREMRLTPRATFAANRRPSQIASQLARMWKDYLIEYERASKQISRRNREILAQDKTRFTILSLTQGSPYLHEQLCSPGGGYGDNSWIASIGVDGKVTLELHDLDLEVAMDVLSILEKETNSRQTSSVY